MLFEIAKRHGLDLEEEAEYGNRKYLEKQDFILAKQKAQLAAQQSKLDELTLKVSEMETLLEDVSAAAYDKAIFQAAMDWNKNPSSDGRVTAVCIWGPNDANTWIKTENTGYAMSFFNKSTIR